MPTITSRAEPAQRHFMKVIPYPPVRLDQDALARVRLVDVPFHPWKLLQQGLFTLDACLRIDRRVLLSERGQREREEENESERPKSDAGGGTESLHRPFLLSVDQRADAAPRPCFKSQPARDKRSSSPTRRSRSRA